MANHSSHSLPVPIYGALFNIAFDYFATDATTPAPTSLDTEVSKDAGTYADCTNEVTLFKEVGGATDAPAGYITLTAAEMTADLVNVQSKSANCVTQERTFRPCRLTTVRASTLAGSADTSHVQLDGSASAVDDFYNGLWIRSDANTGAGQARRILDYVGSTKIATLETALETAVDGTTTFTIGFVENQAVNAFQLDAAISSRGTSTLAAGAEMDLIDAPNATAVLAIQDGLGTSVNQTTILNRLGAWTGSARNTILGALQALFRKDADATVPSDINANLGSGAGTAANTTDSTQAISDVLDTAAADVAGLDGAAMRGTDSAALATTALTNATWTDGKAAFLDVAVSSRGTSTYAGADTAGTTTILGILTGITSLPAWLRGLFRKSAMNATAKTEVNTGGGTYDEATDSQEAQAEVLAAAAADVVNLDGAAMRGTDGAALASDWTSGRAVFLDQLNGASDGTLCEIIKTCFTALSNRVNNASLAALLGIPDTAAHTLITDVPDAVWDEALAGHAVGGSAGAALSAANAPSAATVADAVWDEGIAGHAGVGSTGEALAGATAPSAATVADAVWDEAAAGHVAVGSTGKALADVPTDVETLSAGIHGGGAYGPSDATGTCTVTLTINDGTDPLPDVKVTVDNSAQTTLMRGPFRTDNNGQVEFPIDPGTYKVTVDGGTAYDALAVQTLVAAGLTTAATYSLVAWVPPAAVDPAECALYGYDVDGRSGIVLKFTPAGDVPVEAGTSLLGKTPRTATTDATGYWTVDLVRSSEIGAVKWKVTCEEMRLRGQEITVPDAANAALSTLI